MSAPSTKPPEQLALAADFPPIDRARWQELVAAALRKSGVLAPDAPASDVEGVLATTTYDGIRVLPLYTAEDAPQDGAPQPLPVARPATAEEEDGAPGWDVRQRHGHPDPDVTREAVMTDLENGASSVWLTLGPAGLPIDALGDVLRDVYLDLAPVVLDAGPDTAAAAEAFFAVVGERGVLPHDVRGNLGADPIGLSARTGTAADLGVATGLAVRCRDDFHGLRAITVDATVHHDAGGSDAQELGAAIATGVAYLRALTAAGLSVDEAFGQLEFRLAATADQFLTIAKFRAARRLWARVAEVCGATADAAVPVLHAVTSSAMMTRRDPWVNMLRTTIACFGAGVGGADAVTVQPFDAAIGLPDDFSRRIARNTSSLLLLESNVARVADPAGGSWYTERLTADLAGAAWQWFTEIEGAGGIVAALGSGLVEQRLAETWERRAEKLAHRRDPLTGVSEFPHVDEAPVTRPPYPQAPEATGGLPVHRYAEAFEDLRDAADERTAADGSRPVVFLATLGAVAAHTARATFAANLFGAGGFATVTGGAHTDPADVVEAFRASGARVACLASSDKVYAEYAAPVARALKEAGAEYLWLAGKAGERADSDSDAGVDAYVFAGCNALEVLREAQRRTGVAR